MSMLPFDPERAIGSRFSGSTSDQDNNKPNESDKATYTVEQVVLLINNVLADNLPRKIRVVGEISNLSQRGHWYFSLKDESAILRCIAWQSKTRGFNFDPQDGMEVVATGSIQHYGPQGQTQLYVDKLEPVGAGALELKFRALCEELKALGYFNIENKKTLPTFSQSIAVITSAKGAALQDVLNTAKRRCPAVNIITVDVLVQGDAAAPSIVQGLKTVVSNQHRLGIDAVILTRGGGSIEDLWAFNERIVADTIYNYPIPIVAAIGHETDTTIAELVADQRCATPTQAAMVLIPDRIELTTQVDHLESRFDLAIYQRIRYNLQHLQTIKARLGSPAELLKHINSKIQKYSAQLETAITILISRFRSSINNSLLTLEKVRPYKIAAKRDHQVKLLNFRLMQGIKNQLAISHNNITSTAISLDKSIHFRYQLIKTTLTSRHEILTTLDPASVIKRGYTITRRSDDGSIILNTADVTPHEKIFTQVTNGQIYSQVLPCPVPENITLTRSRIKIPVSAKNTPQTTNFDEQSTHRTKDIMSENTVNNKKPASLTHINQQNEQLNLFTGEK